jgi:hypothetical protein
MLYSLLVAALVGAAALMSERITAELKLPRRFVWLAAMALSVAVPISKAVLGGSSVEARPPRDILQTTIGLPPFDAPALVAAPGSSSIEIDAPLFTWPNWTELGPLFAGAWIASSAAVGAFHLLAWLSLRRKLSRAAKRQVDGVEVRILDEYGPAIFGFVRPQIIVPLWLLDADAGLRQIVLRHEREHIAARDPLTLLAALVLVGAAPWNLPLWWLLRRLRSASEIDCDARVLRGETPETAYAEALLEVQQRRERTPMGAVALIEPVSQLERRIRIMTSTQNPSRPTVVGGCTLAAAALVIAACAVNAPDAGALIRPLGSTVSLGPMQGIGRIVAERHGTEIRNSGRRTALVDLFFDESGALLRSTYEGTDEPVQLPEPAGPASEPRPSGSLAVCLDILEGKEKCEIDAATNRSLHVVRVRIYGFVYSASDGSDSEDIDRRIAERYFGHIFSAAPPENSGYWVLLDSAGTPVGAGQEVLRTPFSEEPAWAQLDAALKQRYQADIQEGVWAPIKNRQSRVVTDRAGERVILYTAWLTEDSPRPAADK